MAKTTLFETTTVIGEVRFLQARTVYATIGDLPAQIAVLLTLLGVGTALWQRSRASHGNTKTRSENAIS